MQPDERHLAARSHLFAGLDAGAVEEILDRAEVRTAERKEHLFRQGEAISGLFLLLAGRVKLIQLGPGGDEVVLRFCGPGELFAAVAALDRPARFPVSAQALSRARVAFWPRPEIRELFERHPGLAANLAQTIAERTHELQSRLREVATERVPRRVAHMLLRLARRAGRQVESGTLIDFPLTRQDLAEMTGTTLYTVSRLLNAWSEGGLVEVGRGRVVVRSESGLEEVAEEEGP